MSHRQSRHKLYKQCFKADVRGSQELNGLSVERANLSSSTSKKEMAPSKQLFGKKEAVKESFQMQSPYVEGVSLIQV